MGLSASQGRMLLLTARKNDLEYRAQQISQRRLILSQQLEQISDEYENATSNRQMKIGMYLKDADGETKVSKTQNLTYAALMSATSSLGSAKSGIEYQENINNGGDYAVGNYYRLIDADGAIVVADESEIPIKAADTTQWVDDAEARTKDSDGFYSVKKSGVETGSKYAVFDGTYTGEVDSDKKDKGTDTLAELLADAGSKGLTVDYSDDKKYVKIGDEYYAIGESASGKGDAGRKVDISKLKGDSAKFEKYTGITLVNNENYVPKNQHEETITGVTYKVEVAGYDKNKRILKDQFGEVARYVIDPTLKRGYTDQNAGMSGPNYLQDCLRNGKYLLQKGKIDENDSKKFKWADLSWDATTDIQDSYYTEDDERAKAKYDRAQQEIQNQDKKLELELDNIETQRKAVTTEEESVKKVIDDNIEGSFKAFA